MSININYYIPDRTTISFVERPWAWKDEMRALRLDVGAEMLLFAALRLAVFESLLPSCTVHVGPPNYDQQKRRLNLINTYSKTYFSDVPWIICREKGCSCALQNPTCFIFWRRAAKGSVPTSLIMPLMNLFTWAIIIVILVQGIIHATQGPAFNSLSIINNIHCACRHTCVTHCWLH